MQQFPCPYCGLRNETEFHFAAESGKTRPDTNTPIDDKHWSDYLYQNYNPKGTSKEVWMHLACREVFLMTRDTVNMDVLEVQALRGEHHD